MTQDAELKRIQTVVENVLEESVPVRRLYPDQLNYFTGEMVSIVSEVWHQFGNRIYHLGAGRAKPGAEAALYEYDQETVDKETGMGRVTAFKRECEDRFNWTTRQSNPAVSNNAAKAVAWLRQGVETSGELAAKKARRAAVDVPTRPGRTYSSSGARRGTSRQPLLRKGRKKPGQI